MESLVVTELSFKCGVRLSRDDMTPRARWVQGGMLPSAKGKGGLNL